MKTLFKPTTIWSHGTVTKYEGFLHLEGNKITCYIRDSKEDKNILKINGKVFLNENNLIERYNSIINEMTLDLAQNGDLVGDIEQLSATKIKEFNDLIFEISKRTGLN